MGEHPEPTASPKLARPVFLLGMMGAGKSSVGCELAAACGAVFVDLDERVELMFANAVSELFAIGEDYFRACERAALTSLVREPGFARSSVVIATGGGVVVDPANLTTMAAVGDCVYLEVPVPTLVARLSTPAQRDKRPLLASESDLAQRLQGLLSAREAAYRSAGLTLSGEGQPPALAREILRTLAPTDPDPRGAARADGLPSGHGSG